MVCQQHYRKKDRFDMWIHEGFICYSETLYTEFTGKEKAEYLHQRN